MKTFNKFLVLLASVFLTCSAQAEVWQARYGVAETFNFKLYNADGTLDVDEADGGTEVSLSCNEGVETTATNDFVDEGTFYSIALTSGETSCERVAVVVAATTTEVFFIQTVDNTSAMIPTIVQTGDSYARLGAPAGASVSADIVVLDNFVDDLESRVGTPSNLGGGATVAANLSDIEGQTDDIGAAGAGLTAIDLPNQTMDITGTLATVTTVTNGVNATSISGDSTAADNLELAFDGTLTGARIFGVERAAFTAQSATGTTLVLDSAAAYGDNTLTGQTVMACGSTQGYCQSLSVASNVGSTDTLTLDGTWPVTPSGTITGYLFATAPGSGTGASAADVWAYSTRTLTALDEDDTTIDLNASYVGGVTVFDEDLTTIDLNATTIGTVTTATTATNLTNLPAITANWLTAAGTAADFTTEVTSGLATAASIAALNNVSTAQVNTEVDTALSDIFLNQLFAADYNPASKPGVSTALLNELVESDSGVSRYTANALEQAPSGTGASAVAIADEVQTRTIAAVTTVNGLAANSITAAATAADFTTEVTASVATQTSVNDLPTNAELATALGTADDAVLAAVAALNDLSADEVWQYIVEDQGSVQARCAMAVLLGVLGGDFTTTTGTTTFEESTGTETRVVSIQNSSSRTATLTCPTY